MAVVAKEFGVMPTVAARVMESDPMHLSVACLELLRYEEAKKAFDNAKDDKALKAWRGSKAMGQVKRNTKKLYEERAARRTKERSGK